MERGQTVSGEVELIEILSQEFEQIFGEVVLILDYKNAGEQVLYSRRLAIAEVLGGNRNS
jgi:hypothetical protein